jgi:3-polyprenyl-4-hydroxybenzoate decarboxylase
MSDRSFRVPNKKKLLTGLSPKILSLSTNQFTKSANVKVNSKQTIIILIRERPLQEERYHLSVFLRLDILLISSFSRIFVS